MNLKTAFGALPVAAVFVAGAAAPVLAHHSHAMFDDSQVVRLTGTVERVNFNNPHAYLFVRVDSAEGIEGEFADGVIAANADGTWAIEMSHVGNMISRGVTPTTIQAGHAIVVDVNPLRDGRPGGNYTHFVSIDGVENAENGNAWGPRE